MGDGELLTLSVALEPPVGPTIDDPGNDDPPDVPPLDPWDSEDPSDIPDDFPLPEPCGPIPGDGCYPFPTDQYNQRIQR
jgi:hypothetical protein